MKNKKKIKKFLMSKLFTEKPARYIALAGIIVLSAGVLAISNIGRGTGKSEAGDFIIKSAQAQSYAAAASPVFRGDDKIFGLASAPVVAFVYEDYTSPFSAVLADNLDRVRLESDGRLAIVVRPFFGSSVVAQEAAVAVDCAGEQGKWIEMRALLFAQAKIKQALVSDLREYAGRLGLDEEDFSACLTNVRKSGKMEQSASEAENYSVLGAPTIFIGREVILGARPYGDYSDSNGDKIEGLKSLLASRLGDK